MGRQAMFPAFLTTVTATYDTDGSKKNHSMPQRHLVRPRWRAYHGGLTTRQEIKGASLGVLHTTQGSYANLKWPRLGK